MYVKIFNMANLQIVQYVQLEINIYISFNNKFTYSTINVQSDKGTLCTNMNKKHLQVFGIKPNDRIVDLLPVLGVVRPDLGQLPLLLVGVVGRLEGLL